MLFSSWGADRTMQEERVCHDNKEERAKAWMTGMWWASVKPHGEHKWRGVMECPNIHVEGFELGTKVDTKSHLLHPFRSDRTEHEATVIISTSPLKKVSIHFPKQLTQLTKHFFTQLCFQLPNFGHPTRWSRCENHFFREPSVSFPHRRRLVAIGSNSDRKRPGWT